MDEKDEKKPPRRRLVWLEIPDRLNPRVWLRDWLCKSTRAEKEKEDACHQAFMEKAAELERFALSTRSYSEMLSSVSPMCEPTPLPLPGSEAVGDGCVQLSKAARKGLDGCE